MVRLTKIEILKIADKFIGKFIVAIMKERGEAQAPRNGSFLFIRPGGIGDAVLLIPAIQAIKRAFPSASIDVLAEKRNSSVFQLCPTDCTITEYDTPKLLLFMLRKKFDVVIDTEQWHRFSAIVGRCIRAHQSVGFATNDRKKLFTSPVNYSHSDYEADSFLKLLKPLGLTERFHFNSPFFSIPTAARAQAHTLLGSYVNKPFIALFPGASISERRWGAGKFRAVAERLNVPVVVVGGKVDAEAGDRITAGGIGLNLAGKMSLSETAAVLEKALILVSGDSGILHIAVGLGKPTVSLFGPGIASKWAPQGNQHIVINKYLPCSPCTKFGTTPHCSINAKCMGDITVSEVVAAVERLVSNLR
jgi:ADP-heptose:LPS heptosyltransferase